MKNIKEFRALIEKYESITLEELENKREELTKHSSFDKYCSEKDIIADTLQSITGFGNSYTCKLCYVKIEYDPKVGDLCKHCVWFNGSSEINPCMEHETFKEIEKSESFEELLIALKNRAKYMKKWLKFKMDD